MSGIVLVITGGRNGRDAGLVNRALTAVHRKHGIRLLVQGEAAGFDRLCKDWARSHGIPTADEPADWDDVDRPGAVVRKRRDGKLYDAAAGGARNQRMIDKHKPDAGVAFPGGSGTADMVRRMKRANIRVWDLTETAPPATPLP